MDKIKCPSLKTLSLYIDKELSAGKTKMVEEHLGGCPDCRSTAEELYNITTQMAKSFDCQRLPMGFEQRFYNRLKEMTERKVQSFVPRLAWAGSAIAGILLFIIAVYGSFDKKHFAANTLNIAAMQDKTINAVSGDNLIKKEKVLTIRAEKKLIDDLANDALKYL